jgi:hypothetical protein
MTPDELFADYKMRGHGRMIGQGIEDTIKEKGMEIASSFADSLGGQDFFKGVGEDITDVFSGRRVGDTARQRREDAEAKHKADSEAHDKEQMKFFKDNPQAEYANQVFQKLREEIMPKWNEKFLTDDGYSKYPQDVEGFTQLANRLRTKAEVDKLYKKVKKEALETIKTGSGKVEGGNQMAGFVRAMMASKSTDPEAIQKGKDKLARTNEARAKRGEPKLTLKQFNEARSIPKKIDVPVMSQSSYNVITTADEEGKEKKIKKFYEFISQKILEGLKPVKGLYPIDALYEEFQRKKEEDRKKAHAEVEKAGRTKRRGKPPREKMTEEQKAEKRREAQRKYYAKKKGVAPEEK